MNTLLEHVSNRELATLAWLIVGLIWVSTKINIWKTVVVVLQITIRRPIPGVLSAMAIYIVVMLSILSLLGLWSPTHLKETIIWTVAVGIVSIIDIARNEDPYHFIKRLLRDAIAVTVLVEFIVGFSSFNIFAELLLVPATAFLGFAYAFYETKDEYKKAASVVSWILFGIVIWMLGDAVLQITDNFAEFAKFNTLADFSLPILLTFFFSPFLVLLAIYVAYEKIFISLRFNIPNKALRSHAKLQCIYAFGWNLELLRRWQGELARTRPETKAQIRACIREVLRVWKLERNPPKVAAAQGWSPFLAKDFLHHPELVADGYHRQVAGLEDWSAHSSSHKINARYPYNRVSYAIYGTRDIVFRLRLTLIAEEPNELDEAIEVFQGLSYLLVASAVPENADLDIAISLRDGETERYPMGDNKEILIKFRDLSINDYESSELTFTLQVVGARLSWEAEATD